MKTTIITKKQYVKPSTAVFEMETQKPMLLQMSGDPQWFDQPGGDWQF